MGSKTKNRLVVVILTCLFVLLSVIAPFLCVFSAGVCISPRYSETFYGELAPMFDRLKNAQGKKIIVVGNSNVAFGVDSALAQRLLTEAGEEYEVCNFGLYGALGTKMMCELSKPYIAEGDIVVFTPELNEQALSCYFSAQEAWYALDGDLSMYGCFSGEERSALVGAFFGYAAKKFGLLTEGKKAEPSGVYARSSFDGHCDLKNYPRPYNIMEGGVADGIRLGETVFPAAFVEYANDYARYVEKHGGSMYYSFAPMNAYAMSEADLEKASGLYQTASELFDFEVMSDPANYIMDGEWFYDSDFHLNESGMTVRTVRLVNDIKNMLGNTTKTNVVLPEKPIVPDPDIVGEGDNTDADMFEYRLDGNYYIVVGLTEKGRGATELTVPYQVDGMYVKTFLPEVFSGNKNIRTVTVQENIRSLSNGCFSGCDGLTNIILKHAEPADISVGYGLLDGAPTDCKISVPRAALSRFENNYFWGKYAKQLHGY